MREKRMRNGESREKNMNGWKKIALICEVSGYTLTRDENHEGTDPKMGEILSGSNLSAD
jgi:hypothetical protein